MDEDGIVIQYGDIKRKLYSYFMNMKDSFYYMKACSITIVSMKLNSMILFPDCIQNYYRINFDVISTLSINMGK